MTTTTVPTVTTASLPRLSLFRTSLPPPSHFRPTSSRKPTSLQCSVAVSLPGSETEAEDEELKSKLAKVGSKVRVKKPMTMYHVPRVPEVELTPDMEGVIKQYVGFWKGKRISANYPFKVEFLIEVEGRGMVKLFAHLREDEFEIVG